MANLYKFWIGLVIGVWSLVIFAGGCGDITNEVSSIEVSPLTATVGVNHTQTFSAIGRDSVGKIVSISLTWSTEGNIGTISSSGMYSMLTAGSQEGTGKVVATYGALSGKANVTITAKGWLTGTVTDPTTLGNVQGIQVYLTEIPSLLDITNSVGKYLIEDIPAGTYEVQTKETALYLSASSEVMVGSGETVTVNLTLTTRPGSPTVPTMTLPF